jgi:hypothetical protein
MKKYLLYLSLVFIVLFAQSCSKGVLVPDQPAVTGSWILSESSQNNGNGWHYFNTGLEEGVFDFYHNGTARYDDGYNLMQGSWSIRRISGGYYDQYGNYYTDLHDSFEVHVYDNYTHGSVDLHFDDVVFTGNKIIGTNYSGNTISKYIFRRY